MSVHTPYKRRLKAVEYETLYIMGTGIS